MPSNKKKNRNIMSYLWDAYHKRNLLITKEGEVFYVETGGPYAVRHKVADLYKRKIRAPEKEDGLEPEFSIEGLLT